MTFPDVQVQTVLRSICQRWPSSTSRPSHSHRCLTHSHPSRYFTRDCSSTFCYKTEKSITCKYVMSCDIMFSFKSHMFSAKYRGYLSFDHVQHTSEIVHPLLQRLQPVIFLDLRNRPHPFRRSRRPQDNASLQLVTLDVLGIIAGLVHWPVACWRFTRGSTLLKRPTAVSPRI